MLGRVGGHFGVFGIEMGSAGEGADGGESGCGGREEDGSVVGSVEGRTENSGCLSGSEHWVNSQLGRDERSDLKNNGDMRPCLKSKGGSISRNLR